MNEDIFLIYVFIDKKNELLFCKGIFADTFLVKFDVLLFLVIAYGTELMSILLSSFTWADFRD